MVTLKLTATEQNNSNKIWGLVDYEGNFITGSGDNMDELTDTIKEMLSKFYDLAPNDVTFEINFV